MKIKQEEIEQKLQKKKKVKIEKSIFDDDSSSSSDDEDDKIKEEEEQKQEKMQIEDIKGEKQKFIEVYYQENKISIGYYENTSKEEICETIKGVFGIDPAVSSLQMQFQDENGIIVFSPKNVPDKKKMFLVIFGEIKKKAENQKIVEENIKLVQKIKSQGETKVMYVKFQVKEEQ
ncbi:hypothetical protein PPERSA_03605 [Pseudocohnilembus persalinus]|uniref:Uncharacterized protein n=1 Tax=Pseudocohnilembus persalinus TaxID=266149 RepID=A0A0V0QE46_PSEPJ|nr:hypothetical protein PPERSA_03605 [Pseudocohnilembus persalinus]|eukprot:KRX00384.1 hypothetical protein PPERSA_03605 [Pseudocohnilembus persalinus]